MAVAMVMAAAPALTWLTPRFSSAIGRLLEDTGLHLVTRVMGLPAAAIPKVGAFVALLRLAEEVFDEADIGWRPLIAVIAATMTLGNLAAFYQDDVRRPLAYRLMPAPRPEGCRK
ncbi:hypothetical protein [Streptosporangium roseum]|uniref:hypothetical protein n=1 Tax=Streptosporangium roseum TaxID=2001 RepID=UPI00332755F1